MNIGGGWEGKHCSKVVNWLIPESATQRMMLEKGDLDIISTFEMDDFNALKKNPDIAGEEHECMSIMYLRLNCAAPPTNDVRVRKALSYCFDRKAFEQVIGARISMPDAGPVAAEQLEGWKPKGLILEYNPDKAKKLLAEAGYPNGFEISCMVQQEIIKTRAISELWQAGLAKAGVKLNIKLMPYTTMITKVNKWAAERDPNTAEHSFIQYLTPHIAEPYGYLMRCFHTQAQPGKPQSARNRMFYSNPKVDELIDKVAITLDQKERMKLYRTAVQMIVDDCPDIWTDKLIERLLMRKVVKGFHIDQTYLGAIPYYNIYKVGP